MTSTTTRYRNRLLGILVAWALIATATLPAASADPPKSELDALKDEVVQLRREVERMRDDLRLIGQRLGQSAARRATVTTHGGVALGREHAPITLVEFSDYQCPYCRRFFDQTFSRLKTQYLDTGKLRYVFRDFPLDSIHPLARKTAEAAHCAGDQGRYWEAHDLFFRSQPQLQPEDLKSYSQKLGLNTATFGDCLDKSKYAQRVQENADDAVKAGVRGTPAFFVGKTGKQGTVDGLFISGARPFEEFQQEIERLLSEK